MKRILYFIQLPPPVHGVSTINKYVFESKIINNNIEKHLLEIKFSDSISELKQVNISKLFRFIGLFIKLFVRLIKIRPQYVYFSIMPIGKGFYRDIIFVMLIKLFSSKLIFHIHNAGIAKNNEYKILNFLYRITFKNSIIIHLSEGLLKKEFCKLSLKNTKHFIVNNGVKEDDNTMTKKSDDKINILFLSNLFPEKGAMTLLNIFNRLYKENSNIRLKIVGDDFLNEKRKVLEYIKTNQLSQAVSYHEKIYGDEKKPFFISSDIFAFPSRLGCESFPLVLLEAMQYKLPIVCFDIGGVSEIVQNNVNGFVIPLGDDVKFGKKLKVLILDSELREKFASKGNEIYTENFTKVIFENKMREMFVEIGLAN